MLGGVLRLTENAGSLDEPLEMFESESVNDQNKSSNYRGQSRP